MLAHYHGSLLAILQRVFSDVLLDAGKMQTTPSM